MENSLSSLIESASSVLVVLPSKPSFDQVAASLALYLSIFDKKTINIYCPSPITVDMNRLVGIDKITPEMNKKNLTIKFVDYESSNIDRVGYDIESGEFVLTITPKSGFASPQKNQIKLDYTGISADLIILIGGKNESDFPIISVSESMKSKVIHLGVRVLEAKREIISLAAPASSVSELVALIIKANNFLIDPDIATNLVMGIESGSGGFSNSETTYTTFEIFADLLKNGGLRASKIQLSSSDFPTGAIPVAPYNKNVSKNETGDLVTAMPQIETQPGKPSGESGAEVSDINPPGDWLQPKIFRGTNVN